MELSLEDRIRRRAYFLWLDRGGAENDVYFWLIAEGQVLAELAVEAETTRQIAATEAELSPARRVNALILLETDSNCEEAA
jgi:hypothetical protein